jgi:hypothetical protein
VSESYGATCLVALPSVRPSRAPKEPKKLFRAGGVATAVTSTIDAALPSGLAPGRSLGTGGRVSPKGFGGAEAARPFGVEVTR